MKENIKKSKKFKLQKGHLYDDSYDELYCIRHYYHAEMVEKDSPTLKKVRNLLSLYDKAYECGIEELDCDEFCKDREIKKTSYLRLVKLVQRFFDICKGNNVTEDDSPSTKKYINLLTMYLELNDRQLSMQNFCKKQNIGRTTFFRYITIIENYLYYENINKVIAYGESGNYALVDS